MNTNSILLRRCQKIYLPKSKNKLDIRYVASLNANLQQLGCVMSNKLLKRVGTLDLPDLISFYNQLVENLKELKGVKNYEPMYPNFPQQVMDMSEAELYINAILHYLSVWVTDVTGDRECVWLPKYNKEKREMLQDKVQMRVIDLAELEDFHELMQNLITANTSISSTDKDDVKWYLENYDVKLTRTIPHKENLAFVGGVLINQGKLKNACFKTATDVLRLAVAISDGDISLAENTKFRKFTRKERRQLLELLESVGEITEDMLRWKNRWIRLGERLHPGEYKNLKKVNSAFDVLRNNRSFSTFNSRVENLLQKDNATESCALLSQRPGVFARRLDHLLRSSSKQKLVCNHFSKVVEQVSTPVLLQVMSHFQNRVHQNNLRVFFPKGNVAKLYSVENVLPKIPETICESVIRICEEALVERFSELPNLGKCYIDGSLSDCLVPFSQRSASKSLRTLIRGSRIPFSADKNTIRFFIWWKEGQDTGRVDLDLSAMMLDDNWVLKEYISYCNLKSNTYQACHSGDITSAPKGACEFIDVDIPSILKYGGRYVVMNVNSFTHQKFSTLPECSAGWMLREYPKSGEIFDARTVEDKLDLTCDQTACIPLVLDLKERKVIWLDMGYSGRRLLNNIHSNQSTITTIGKAFTQIKKPNLHDLFTLHAKARGKVVSDKSKADTVFTLTEGITPFQTERIMSEFLK